MRRLRDTPSRVTGVPDGSGAEPAPEVEAALGSDEGLALIVADRGEAAARSMHRAMRLMLGDVRFARLVEPHAVDLADVLALSQRRLRRGPLVLLIDDAPPALLDQFDDATRALLSAQLRCVVVARASSLDAFLPDAAMTVLRGADRAVLPLTTDATATPPADALTRAVVDTVTDWDRLSLGPALTPVLLGRLVLVHLPAGEPVPDDRDVRRAVRHGIRSGHVLRTRRRAETHLAPARAWPVVADGDGPLARAVPEAFARALREHLTDADRALAGRVALARAERDVAVWLFGGLPPESVPPVAAEQVGSALAARASTRDRGPTTWGYPGGDRTDTPGPLRDAAIRWLRSAAERGDAVLSRRATRSAGLIAYVASDVATARELLLIVGDDETDPQVQIVLADLATDTPEGRAEARRRFELVLTVGDEELASGAAGRLARMAIEDGRTDDAVSLLAVVAARHPDPDEAHQARLRRLHLLRDLGRHDEADLAVSEMQELLRPEDPVERRQDVALAVAVVRRRHGDLDGVATALGEATGRGGVAGLRAAVELAELELSRGRWTQALAAVSGPVKDRVARKAPKDLLARRHAACGEAAYQLGEIDTARKAFTQLSGDARALLRLGEIALSRGHVLDTYRSFVAAQQAAPGSDAATRAAELAAPIHEQADRIAAQEAAQEAAAAAERAAMLAAANIMPA